MRKQMQSFTKKVVAMALMAATVAVATPSLAMAVTASDKGCSGNTSTGYHYYREYCLGFSHSTPSSHKVYDTWWDSLWKTENYIICDTVVTYHGTREECKYCGKLTGVFGSHAQATIHYDCDEGIESLGLCGGIGSDVTALE